MRKLWKLPRDIKMRSVYEAGRDGFRIHRWLESPGIDNIVVDAASIGVSRRKRRVKTARSGVNALVRQLMRGGGRKARARGSRARPMTAGRVSAQEGHQQGG